MRHIFDYRDSSQGVYVDMGYLLAPNTSFAIANNLFYGTGRVSGTLRFTEEGLTQTELTSMGQSGVIDVLGGVLDIFYRNQTGVEVPASFDASTDFTGIYGGQDGNGGGFVGAYFRLFGIAMPTLNWDNTATGLTYGAALADFQDNLNDAAADYLAQIQAVLATVVTNSIDVVDWGISNSGTAADPGFVMHYTPAAGTSLTYGDFLSVTQDQFGRTYLASQSPDLTGLGDIFGADEIVRLVLTDNNDVVTGWEMGARKLEIVAGAGDDRVQIFYTDDNVLPSALLVVGGLGNDTVQVGAYLDSTISGGAGDDMIDLQGYSEDAPVVRKYDLRGESGNDGIIGAVNGRNLITGGSGSDTVQGGDRFDSLFGGNQNDSLVGYGGFDSIDGGSDRDSIWGGLGNDSLFGGSGADSMFGDNGGISSVGGDDRMFGGDGADFVGGETGRDTLDGGTGDDVLMGGAALDTFVFRPGTGRDLITDYVRGEAIQIDASLWSGTVADFVAANVVLNTSGILFIRLGGTDRVVIQGDVLVPQDFLDVISFI